MTKDYVVIVFTLLVGMVLTLIPMPPWAVWLRPNWMLVIVIFWLMTASHRVSIVFAWLVGLFMDLLVGTLLGQQALIFCVIGFLVLKFQSRLSLMPILQQTAVIFLLSLFAIVLDRSILMFFQRTPLNWLFWLPALTTAVVWPWVSGLLYLFQVKLHVADMS